MTVEQRPLGSSGIAVAPLALGGNVFGWTADEADELRHSRRLRRCGRQHDRHRRRLFGLGARPSRRRKRDRHRPVAEARSGEARQGRDRDQGRLLRRPCAGQDRAPRLRCFAAAARDRGDRPLLSPPGRSERSRWPTALARWTTLPKAGKIRSIGLSQYSPERLDEAMATAGANGLTSPCALQTWYNMVSRDKLEGPLLDAALRHGHGGRALLRPRQRLPHRQVPQQGRSRQKPARPAQLEYLRRSRRRCSTRSTRSPRKPAPRWRPSPWRGPALNPASPSTLASATSVDQLKELTAAIDLKLTAGKSPLERAPSSRAAILDRSAHS